MLYINYKKILPLMIFYVLINNIFSPDCYLSAKENIAICNNSGQSGIKSYNSTEGKYAKIRDNLANSFLKLYPENIFYLNEPKSQRWNYEYGLILETFRQLWQETNDRKYYDYIKKNMDIFVNEDGSIKTYRVDEYNLDQIAPGRALLFLYQSTGLKKYKIAADSLRKQLQYQPRTNEGGFWHKKIYPFQMWLDGLYMGEPFYAIYSQMFNEKSSFDDILNQFVFIYNHTRDPKTGLLYHGWDESRQQKWADKVTGNSPHFWSRAIGWYLMAIVDVLDYFPEDHIGKKRLIKILNEVSESLIKFMDPETGLWYQVIDQGKRRGNYLEASGSCMYIYAFAKGVNKGYLETKYSKIAERSFDGVMKYLTKTDSNGVINLLNTCQGAGLGGNPYRNGSYDYYISEPKRTNDFKGYGPFILVANELAVQEKNKADIGSGKIVGLDYFYNNEWKDGKQYHYIWEDSLNSGFSELGEIFKNNGAKITQIKKEPAPEELKKLSVYIIVDPDTPLETEKPNFIENEAIKNIVKWVNDGGVLILLGNDSGNCEFDHFNKLAENFGIKFKIDSKNRVIGKNFEMGAFENLPSHPIFSGVQKIYMKEISTLNISSPAKPILISKGDNIFAESTFGKGYVFVIGDPWLYNEYIDNRKLPKEFENIKAAKNLVKWILKKAARIKYD